MKTQKIVSSLLKWFVRNKRPLPWRKTQDPYRIWVSETMLQQTQVNTVIPYYRRWMRNFPSLTQLAQAPLSQVLKSWEGLGYYARARNLQRAAKIVLEKFGGKLPPSREALEKLPGIGRYTAGALASIAFNQPEPVLDGNVKRVLSRVFAVKEPVNQTAGERKLWEIAKGLLERGFVSLSSRGKGVYGDFNQALMELGALICLPENPKCSLCPLERTCQAHRLGKETFFPVKIGRVNTEKLKTVAAVIWKKGRVLLQKQPLQGRWGGLWTFPQWTLINGKREKEFLERRMEQDLGLSVQNLGPLMEIEHAFTKYRVHLRVFQGETAERGRGKWIEPQKLARLPFPKPHQKIAHWIQKSDA